MFHQGGSKSCTGTQERFNSTESKFQIKKRFDSRLSTEDRKEKEMKMDSFLGSERNKNQQLDVENCNKLNFLDQNFIDQYIQKLENKICRLQSSASETSTKNAPLEIRENSCQKINNCDKESSFREIKMKNPDPNKLRYDETSLGSPCSPDKFAYTLKAVDWEAEYEKLMHQEMPPLDLKSLGLPSWPAGSCGPPQSETSECQQPKCQMKLPPLRKEERIKLNSDEVNKLLAEYNYKKKCAEAPPLPPKWRTAPSYSFLYEDVPLELTLFSKKSFDEN